VTLLDVRRRLLSRPRLWFLLLLWPMAALLLILAPLGIYQSDTAVGGALLSAVVALAVASLILLALLARRFYRALRELRNRLFEGDYEMALDIARRDPALGKALGFEKALMRMLEFDSRRADKVAALTRLLSSILQEAGLPFFVADLEEDLMHLSRAARQLFGVNVDRFSLLALLLMPANREFAALYGLAARGERARAEAVLTLHLPVRQAARELAVRLFAVQSDEGMVLYILGFLSAPKPNAAVPPKPEDPARKAPAPSPVP